MADNANNFSLLIELAKEKSSEKRRELLRQVTDAFLAPPEDRSDREAELFDEIVGAVAMDLEIQVRVELSRRVAKSRHSIRRTARRLAFDVIEVARPVIEESRALTQSDLVDVIQQTSRDHMMAVTKRPDIGERVSSALVAKGGDPILVSLLQNASAKMSRETYERVADRAMSSMVLHAPFVRRQHVPLDLLNEIYVKVSKELRSEIMGRFQGATPADLDQAIEASQDRLSTAYGALPRDYQLAKEYVDELEERKTLHPSSLEWMLRDNKQTSFLIAFARLVGIDFDLAGRLVEAKDIDSIAMLCRAAGFERSHFATLITLIVGGGGGGLSRVDRYGDMYEKVPVVAAQRAMRFWKIRAKTAVEKSAAA